MSDNAPSKPINGNARVIIVVKDKLSELNREIADLTRRREALINQAEGLRIALDLLTVEESK